MVGRQGGCCWGVGKEPQLNKAIRDRLQWVYTYIQGIQACRMGRCCNNSYIGGEEP